MDAVLVGQRGVWSLDTLSHSGHCGPSVQNLGIRTPEIPQTGAAPWPTTPPPSSECRLKTETTLTRWQKKERKEKSGWENAPLKLPMKATPSESWLEPLAWAPTTPHPRPSNTAPSNPTRKLKRWASIHLTYEVLTHGRFHSLCYTWKQWNLHQSLSGRWVFLRLQQKDETLRFPKVKCHIEEKDAEWNWRVWATHLYPMSSKFRSFMWDLWMLRSRSLHPLRPEHFGRAVWWMTTLWAGPFRFSLLFGGAAPHWALETTFTGKEATHDHLTVVFSLEAVLMLPYPSGPWRSDWPPIVRALLLFGFCRCGHGNYTFLILFLSAANIAQIALSATPPIIRAYSPGRCKVKQGSYINTGKPSAVTSPKPALQQSCGKKRSWISMREYDWV